MFSTSEIDKLPPKIKKLILSANDDDHKIGMVLATGLKVDMESVGAYAGWVRGTVYWEDMNWWEHFGSGKMSTL